MSAGVQVAIVGANGAFSTVARCLGLNRDVTHGPALDAEVETYGHGERG